MSKNPEGEQSRPASEMKPRLGDRLKAPGPARPAIGRPLPGHEKQLFAARLNELCDDAKIPPKGKNRQKIVGDLFDVSQKGARKWLEGEAFPAIETCVEIAKHFDCAFEWLMTGRGLKRDSKLVPEEVLYIARRIAEMPKERRETLMDVFGRAGTPEEA